MKLLHRFIGLLALIGLLGMALLIIPGPDGLGRISPAQARSLAADERHAWTTTRPEVIGHAAVPPQTDRATSTNISHAQALAFDIELTASSTEVQSWTEMEYIIRYTVNNQPASNVIITSSVPLIAQDCDGNDIFALYMYSTPTGFYSFTNHQITWNLGAVAAGTTSEVKFVIRLPSDPLDGTTFTNQATIQSDGVTATSATVATTLKTTAKNSLAVFPPRFVRPGDTFCVPIDFRNEGTSHDTNLTLTHQHDLAATTFISATQPNMYQGDTVTWQKSCVPTAVSYYGTIFIDRYKTTLQAAASPVITVGDTIANQFTYDTDLLPAGQQNFDQTVDLGPHAGYTGSSRHIFYSTTVQFAFNFFDDTSWPLEDLELYARVPLSTTFVEFREGGDFRCVPPNLTMRVSNDPDPVTPPPLTSTTWLPYTPGAPDPHAPPGTTWVYVDAEPIDWFRTFYLIVDYTGLSGGTVITSTGAYTSNQTNGDITEPFTIPAFELSKFGPATVNASEDMTYNIWLKNVSGATSQNVVVTDTLPAEVTFVSGSNSPIYDSNLHQVIWNFNEIVANQQEFLQLTVHVPRGLLDKTTIVNQAELTFAGYTGSPIVSSYNTLVRSIPKFQVTHEPEKLFVPSGSLITYTITYSNLGTGASNDALVTALIPDKTVFVAATTPNNEVLSINNTEVRWVRPFSVPVDIPQRTTLIVRNDPPSPEGTTITNVVTISSSQSLLAVGNLTKVTVGVGPTSDDNDDDDDDDTPLPSPPSPSPTSPPPVTPTVAPTTTPPFTRPLYLPETGLYRPTDRNLIIEVLVFVGLALLGWRLYTDRT